MSDRFEKHARTVTLLTFVSRVTGLARDAALSRIFGVTALTDAFWFAFMIPNLFRRLFGEGALSAAFLPVYAQLDRDDPRVARQLASLTISLMMIFLGGVTLVGELALLLLAMRADHDNIALRLMMIMLPYMPMVCMVAILGAMLQVHGRFGPTASAPIVLNLCLVAASWGLIRFLDHADHAQEVRHIVIVSWSVIVAGLLQVIWSIASLRAGNRAWWVGGINQCREAFGPMKAVLRQAWPMFIGLGVLQINTFIDGVVASYPSTIGSTIFGVKFPLDAGALTSLNNAQRLYEFPLGVFGIAVATAIFPALARVANDAEAFAAILRRGLRLVIYIGLPASVGLILVRVPLTAAVLQGKHFTAQDTLRVAKVLMGYAPAIWAYSMTHTLTRAFYAKGDSRTPVRVAVAMVLLNFSLNITLIWTPLKEAGLAWSTAIAAIVQVFILLRLTRRYASHVVDDAVVKSWMRTVIVTAVMAAAVLLVNHQLPQHAPTWRWAVFQLAVLVGVGAAAVIVSSLALRMPELWWALGKSPDKPATIHP